MYRNDQVDTNIWEEQKYFSAAFIDVQQAWRDKLEKIFRIISTQFLMDRFSMPNKCINTQDYFIHSRPADN